jgi:hypothetical protein
MKKYELKPEPKLEPEKHFINTEQLETDIPVTRETVVNAVNTLREMVEQNTLSPEDVKGALTQCAIALQGLAAQQNTLEKTLNELSDNFNLYANQSLEIQRQHKERVARSLDVMDRELKSY